MKNRKRFVCSIMIQTLRLLHGLIIDLKVEAGSVVNPKVDKVDLRSAYNMAAEKKRPF